LALARHRSIPQKLALYFALWVITWLEVRHGGGALPFELPISNCAYRGARRAGVRRSDTAVRVPAACPRLSNVPLLTMFEAVSRPEHVIHYNISARGACGEDLNVFSTQSGRRVPVSLSSGRLVRHWVDAPLYESGRTGHGLCVTWTLQPAAVTVVPHAHGR